MDPETMKWFASLGVGGALAVMMFLIHRKDTLGHIESIKDMKAESDRDRAELRDVVRENTKALANNTAAVANNTDVSQAMVRAVERLTSDAPRAPNHWKGRG